MNVPRASLAADLLVSVFEQSFDSVRSTKEASMWLIGDDVASAIGVDFSGLREVFRRPNVLQKVNKLGFNASIQGSYVVVNKIEEC